MIYDKDFLVQAFLSRYSSVLLEYTNEQLDKFVDMINNFYNEVGKDKFRVYCSLDAEALRKFRLVSNC